MVSLRCRHSTVIISLFKLSIMLKRGDEMIGKKMISRTMIVRTMISRTMIGKTKLAVCILALLTLIACGGSNQPTAEQRAALAQPLFETEHKIIDRRSGLKVNLNQVLYQESGGFFVSCRSMLRAKGITLS